MSEPLHTMQDFREGTLRLAVANGYPVIAASGTFVPDARAAWFVEAVETWHEALQEPRHDPGWFHASALYKSDAELVDSYLGVSEPEVLDARKLRLFDMGHNRDQAWKGYIQQAGLSIADDGHRLMRLDWLRLKGECDDILRDPDGNLCVYEGKTMNNGLFSKLEEPQEGHVEQVHAYMGGMGIRQAIINYENKNSSEIRVFYVPFDEGRWERIIKRLQHLRAVAEGRVSSAT